MMMELDWDRDVCPPANIFMTYCEENRGRLQRPGGDELTKPEM